LLGSISYYIELLLVLVAITAFFYIVYSGIQMATAFGNESKYTGAKNTLLHAIIGIIVATLAYSIVGFTTSFFGVSVPNVYDQNGQTNDPTLVVANVAAKAMTSLPGPDLTQEEIDYIFGTESSLGDHLSLTGASQAIYIVSEKPFVSAGLFKADGTPLSLNEGRLPDGRYWVRGWGTVKDLSGAELKIKQHDDKTNRDHEKTVTITTS
jgi:hypothetical protein